MKATIERGVPSFKDGAANRFQSEGLILVVYDNAIPSPRNIAGR